MEKQKSPNCKILISGCGMSFGAGERPTWIKVLKLCGLDITDLTGPGVSNTLITNNIIEELYKKNYDFITIPRTNNFFNTTNEIIQWLDWYPNHYKAMNPNLPKFNGIPNPFYLWNLKK